MSTAASSFLTGPGRGWCHTLFLNFHSTCVSLILSAIVDILHGNLSHVELNE